MGIEQNTEGWAQNDPSTPTVIVRSCSSITSFINQSHTLNKVQYLAGREVFKVTWFHKMMIPGA